MTDLSKVAPYVPAPNRTVAMEMPRGSRVYNLHRKDSDYDYYGFTFPTFEDMYHHHHYKDRKQVGNIDITYHDIRVLPNFLFRSNIDMLHILEGDSIQFGDGLSGPIVGMLIELLEMKDRIYQMNLPNMFDATIGTGRGLMYEFKKKGTSNAEVIDRFGWDPKKGMHSYRQFDFLIRFAETDFQDFGHAIRYDGEDKWLMECFRDGLIDENVFVSDYLEQRKKQAEALRDKYKSVPMNDKTIKELNDLVYQIVRVYRNER